MTLAETQNLVQLLATVIGISGGLLGLVKYFSDKREKELREWQKVVLYRIARQNEAKAIAFTELLEKYRIEAQAFVDVNLRKTELSEDALRRVLLELVSSNIFTMLSNDCYRLKLPSTNPDPLSQLQLVNDELVRLVAPNPFVYTLDEVLKEISPKVGIEIPLLRTNFRQAIAAGVLALDDQGRLAFPR